jgi:hypothetical protein
MPGATDTQTSDIFGGNVVGWYINGSGNHGFLYDGSNWTTIDFPLATQTYITGIYGNDIVGYYTNASGDHGFVYSVPEPSTMILLISGLSALLLRRKK